MAETTVREQVEQWPERETFLNEAPHGSCGLPRRVIGPVTPCGALSKSDGTATSSGTLHAGGHG